MSSINLREEVCRDIALNRELDALYDSLISVLKQEVDVYRDLFDTFVCEREVLIRSSAEELSESNAKKETCILKARMLNEARGKLVRRVSRVIGIPEEKVDLSTLISYAGPRHRGVFEECQETLQGLLKRVHEMNERNKVLLDSSLLYVQKSMDFISQLMSPSSVYQSTGELRTKGMVGTIVCRKG